jgi:hypothetical protein
MLIPAKK